MVLSQVLSWEELLPSFAETPLTVGTPPWGDIVSFMPAPAARLGETFAANVLIKNTSSDFADDFWVEVADDLGVVRWISDVIRLEPNGQDWIPSPADQFTMPDRDYVLTCRSYHKNKQDDIATATVELIIAVDTAIQGLRVESPVGETVTMVEPEAPIRVIGTLIRTDTEAGLDGMAVFNSMNGIDLEVDYTDGNGTFFVDALAPSEKKLYIVRSEFIGTLIMGRSAAQIGLGVGITTPFIPLALAGGLGLGLLYAALRR